jgi:hypothetical protein
MNVANCFLEEEEKRGERRRERNEEKQILRMFVKSFESKVYCCELSVKKNF